MGLERTITRPRGGQTHGPVKPERSLWLHTGRVWATKGPMLHNKYLARRSLFFLETAKTTEQHLDECT